MLQCAGQFSDGFVIAHVKVIHPGAPGGGVVAEILFGELTLDFRPVCLAVFHTVGQVQHPGIHRRQFDQRIALFDKITLQAVTGEELRNNKFIIIPGGKHLIKRGAHLVTQVQIGGQHAEGTRFQTLVNTLVDGQLAEFFLGRHHRAVIRRPAAGGVDVACLTFRVPVCMLQGIVQMRHKLRLEISLAMELIAPAFCHVLFHYLVAASAFILQHSDNAQYRKFFLALRRRGVHLFDQTIKQGGQVTLLQQLQVGLLHIRADTPALIQSHIGQAAAIAPVTVGQRGVTHRVE